MAVVARFYVSGFTKKPDGSAEVSLQAVTSKENARWSQYTPSASITMSLTRLASGARKQFEDAVDRAAAERPYTEAPFARPECLVTFDFDNVPAWADPGRATDAEGKDIGYASDEA